MTYRNIHEWLDELEGYSLRRERIPNDAFGWIETAWRLATMAERERCVDIAQNVLSDDPQNRDQVVESIRYSMLGRTK